ncbi:unnamed protein product [Didymodactylos carnosus]|uniref:Uncharacterized protein n=1 Tax=Didymodactylos carnosus TaxID=1234261 RepID=A0A815Y6J8_9BILA|nr:unnamed protein product [Didymodactylos carnosus]CAF4428749.1 unnamed protein product [Didymodactylos carnosus]
MDEIKVNLKLNYPEFPLPQNDILYSTIGTLIQDKNFDDIALLTRLSSEDMNLWRTQTIKPSSSRQKTYRISFPTKLKSNIFELNDDDLALLLRIIMGPFNDTCITRNNVKSIY